MHNRCYNSSWNKIRSFNEFCPSENYFHWSTVGNHEYLRQERQLAMRNRCHHSNIPNFHENTLAKYDSFWIDMKRDRIFSKNFFSLVCRWKSHLRQQE